MTCLCSLEGGLDLAMAFSVECSLLSWVRRAHLEVFSRDLAGLQHFENGDHFVGRQLDLVSEAYPLHQSVVVLLVVFERQHEGLALSFH